MRYPMRRTGLVLASVVALTASACGSADQGTRTAAEGYPMTVRNCGRDVTIEKRPEKLYVIGGEAGTLVHAAGGTDRIGTFSPLAGEPLGDAEEALKQRTQAPIKSSKDISREAIIAASPDLVVTYGLNEFGPEDLAEAGIPTLVISGYCGGFGAGQSDVTDPLGELFSDVETLGKVLGTGEQATRAAAGLRDRVEAVREKARQTPPANRETAAVFVATSDSPLGAYGRRSMVHQQLEGVGLSNVFEGTDERYFEPNTESLVSSAPKRLIALYEPGDIDEKSVREALTGRSELATIPAIAEGRVLVLDFYYSGHGTLAVDGIERLAEQLGG